MKSNEIRAFYDPHFPVFGQNWRFRLNTGKYGYDSVNILENMDWRKPFLKVLFGYISRSEVLCDIS